MSPLEKGTKFILKEKEMQDFDFHNRTKLIFGEGTIDRIGKEIHEERITKVLLVAGGGSIRILFKQVSKRCGVKYNRGEVQRVSLN